MITHYSTRVTEPAHRLGMWNDVMAQTYSGLSASALRPGFSAEISVWKLGDVVLTRPASTAVAVERRHAPERQPTSRTLKLHVFQSGTGRLLHRRREIDLRQGDIAVCAGEENYRFEMHGNHELLVAELDLSTLAEQPEWLDDVIGRVIPREKCGVRLIHDFLLSLWREGDALDEGESRESFGRVFADLVQVGLKPSPQTSPAQQTPLWQRAKAIIAGRISDSSLTPASLAQELGVGLRSLQTAGAVNGTTPGSYIIERRLMLAQERLATHRNRSITQVAFDCGFEDSGYFSRRFRQRFGVSPAQYRSMN